MKKILLTCVAAITLAANANAQLAEGSVFPYPGGATGALTAVNSPFTGQRFNFDSISNAGYTIFIDISATWCNPCWNYHNSKQLDTLWAQHGPTGMPGVNASTTNDVYVFFFQGEGTSNLAELYNVEPPAVQGSSSLETPYATCSQGNWTTGTPFPMIDDTTSSDATYGTNAIDGSWNIMFFPTVYMVCRDHLVHNLTQPTYTAAYAAAQASCPTYAPAAGSSVDAKAVPYLGADYFVCSANPSISFQNYSSTASISTASIIVKDGGGTTVATVPYTGAAIPPYGLGSVTVPAFVGSTFSGYNYTVNVTGDVNAANNASAASLFKVYDAGNVGTLPFSDNLSTGYSNKYTLPSDSSIFVPDNAAWPGCPNPAGVTSTHYFIFDFYDFQAGTGTYDMVVGNFNTDHLDSVKFSFEESYAEYTGVTTDEMTVLVSNDCGTTWHTVWSELSPALATAASTTSSWQPTGASDWALKTVTIPIADTSKNMMIKFGGTSGYGNFAWVTDLGVTGYTEGVPQILVNNDVTIAPNPAKDMANISLTLTEKANVQVQVMDAVGRIVNTLNEELSAGAQKIELSTVALPTGVYTVKISTGSSVIVKKLAINK